MTKFKVGDKVRQLKNGPYQTTLGIRSVGTIVQFGRYFMHVRFEEAQSFAPGSLWALGESELELVHE